MAESPPQVAKLIVTFTDGYITTVAKDETTPQPDIEVTTLTPKDKKKFRRSPNGLRPIETIYEATDANSSLATDADSTFEVRGPNDCYMIMGGFKIKVPCP